MTSKSKINFEDTAVAGFFISAEVKRLAAAVLVAQKVEAKRRPIVEKYQAEVLAQYPFLFVDSAVNKRDNVVGQRITHIDQLFRLRFTDAMFVMSKLDQKRDEFFTGFGTGFCPLKMAECDLLEASSALVEQIRVEGVSELSNLSRAVNLAYGPMYEMPFDFRVLKGLIAFVLSLVLHYCPELQEMVKG